MFPIKTYDDFNNYIDSLLLHTNSEVETFQIQCEELRKRDLQISERIDIILPFMKTVNACKLSQNYNEILINMTAMGLNDLENRVVYFENMFRDIDSKCLCNKFFTPNYIRDEMYCNLLELSLNLKNYSEELEELISEINIQLKPLTTEVVKSNNLNVCYLMNQQLEMLIWIEEQLNKISFQLTDIINVQAFINRTL